MFNAAMKFVAPKFIKKPTNAASNRPANTRKVARGKTAAVPAPSKKALNSVVISKKRRGKMPK